VSCCVTLYFVKLYIIFTLLCEIYWFKLFTYCASFLCYLWNLLHLNWLRAVVNCKKKNGWNKSTVQIPDSTYFLHLRRRHHFRRGIGCGTIWGSASSSDASSEVRASARHVRLVRSLKREGPRERERGEAKRRLSLFPLPIVLCALLSLKKRETSGNEADLGIICGPIWGSFAGRDHQQPEKKKHSLNADK